MALNKLLCYMMLIFSASYNLYAVAQTTTYYTLTKIDEYGKIDSKCDGGQFVKISKNVCLDTDADGNDIGNGKLYRDVNNRSNEHVYTGDSFHGKARYIFSADYSTLTVEINPHFKYYYKKSSAPNGVLTCSLIKKRSEENGSVSDGLNQSNQWINSQGNQWNTPQGNSGYTPNNNTYNGSNNSSTTTQPTRKFKCPYCNGAGRIEKNDNPPPNFGITQPRSKRCDECGKVYDPNVSLHYHQKCLHCRGTGYN